MKRIHLKCLGAFIFVFSLASCDKEIELDSKLEFSTLSVEQQKAKIEDNGLELMDAVEKVTETKLFKTMDDFMSTNENTSVQFLQILGSALTKHDAKSFINVDRQLRVAAEDDSFWGEYVWIAEIQDFEKIESLTNQLIARFPASSSDTENQAVLTITYQESTVKMPDSEDLLPSSIICVVSIEGEEALKAEFTGEYKSDGMPANVSYLMTVADYKWEASLKNTTKELSEEFEYSYQSKTLLKSVASLKGEMTVDAINNADDMDDILSFASVYFQIMDVAILSGVKDVNALVKEMNALTPNDTKEFHQSECDVINKHLISYGAFVSDKKKFADVEFYVEEITDSWWDIDPDTYEQYEVEETFYAYAPRFVLSDNSKVSIEEYFSSGFDNLIQKLLEMLPEFEEEEEYYY